MTQPGNIWLQGSINASKRVKLNAYLFKFVIFTLGSITALAGPPHASAVSFTKVLDSTTSYAGVGQFLSFNDLAFDGTQIALIGEGSTIGDGVFLWDGAAVNTLASTSTVAPSLGAATFTNFSQIDMDAGNVAFFAQSESGITTYDGAYTTLGGPLRRVRDSLDTMPGSAAPFRDFSNNRFDIAIEGNNIAFSAFGTNGAVFNEGVYLQTGSSTPVKIADRSDPIPGFTDDFIFFGDVDVSGGEVVFDGGRGTGGGNGFYTTLGASAGSHRIVLNADTVIPGLTNPIGITSPNTIRIDGPDIAVKARGNNDVDGIYIDTNGVFATAVDENSIDPVTGNNFLSLFTNYSLDGGQVAYGGFASGGPTGYYVSDTQAITHIISHGDALDGKQVSSVRMYPSSLHSNQFVFKAVFTDGTEGIYLADLDTSPPPAGTTLTIPPIFDVQAEPSGVPGEFTVTEGDTTLFARKSDFLEQDARAIMEFDLGAVPDDATITALSLSVDVIQFSSGSDSGGPRIKVYGYAGNRVPDTADATMTQVLLTVADEITESGVTQIPLDVGFVQQMLATNDYFGLLLVGSDNERIFGFSSTEWTQFFPPPSLSITYTQSLEGDLDGDGFVGINDLNIVLSAWNQNVPPGNPLADPSGDGFVGIDDLGLVLGNWNAGTPPTSGATGVIPEPASISTMAFAAALLIRRNRKNFS